MQVKESHQSDEQDLGCEAEPEPQHDEGSDRDERQRLGDDQDGEKGAAERLPCALLLTTCVPQHSSSPMAFCHPTKDADMFYGKLSAERSNMAVSSEKKSLFSTRLFQLSVN